MRPGYKHLMDRSSKIAAFITVPWILLAFPVDYFFDKHLQPTFFSNTIPLIILAILFGIWSLLAIATLITWPVFLWIVHCRGRGHNPLIVLLHVALWLPLVFLGLYIMAIRKENPGGERGIGFIIALVGLYRVYLAGNPEDLHPEADEKEPCGQNR